ncbi:hypothetical protein [Rhodoferax sp.]|uniref:hypothetical protein n=1 Tax=Rhodoferax sp. TaxID=50421 RepID=UPI00274AA888|nr:hypothetical protein [Rhodoferax sp.]
MSSKFEWRPFAWNNLRAFFSGSMSERDRVDLENLYARVKAAYERSPYSEEYAELDFIIALVAEAAKRAQVTLPEKFDWGVKECVYSLTKEDPIPFGMPVLPDVLTIETTATYRSILSAKERFLSDPPRYEEIWREKVIRILEGFFRYLPPLDAEGPFSAAIVNVCNAPEIIERIIVTMFDDDVLNADLFASIRAQLERNLIAVSGVTIEEVQRRPKSIVLPTASKLPPQQVASSYLHGTAFSQLFELSVPFYSATIWVRTARQSG